MNTMLIPHGTAGRTHWRFACQNRGNTAYMHILELSLDDTGPTVVAKLRTEYNRVKGQAPYKIWDKTGLFWNHVVEDACLSENGAADLEAQTGPRYILVSNRRQDPEFTAAFDNPEILSAADGFLGKNERFAVRSPSAVLQETRQVIFIRRELKRFWLWVSILLGMILCVGAGVIVGIWTKSVDLGIGVISALATIVASGKAFAFWVYKQ